MNFFEQQDLARKNTRRLVGLFILAVLVLVALANVIFLMLPLNLPIPAQADGVPYLLDCVLDEQCRWQENIPWRVVVSFSGMLIFIIAAASLFKAYTLSKGGVKVAEWLGGEEVSLDSQDFLHKRLLNVVQEMALAANCPIPRVFVLPQEQGLNAFAAGFSSKDAVVAVTQGLLESTSREQLQGVVAHEFSHIVHGDSLINMRMVSVLYGILFIAEMGFVCLRVATHGLYYGSSSNYTGRRAYSRRRHSRSGDDARMTMGFIGIGLSLVVLGYLGVFFGNMIKAAISREREYLADASAVKYTRNPDSIADALKVILSQGGRSSGSYIKHAHANELSHFFFSKAVGQGQSIFATHPPLVDRIYRIEPNWDGSTVTRNQLNSVRQKASAAYKQKQQEKTEQKQQQSEQAQALFDLTASALVADLMMADKKEEDRLERLANGQNIENADSVEQDSISAVEQLKQWMNDPVSASAALISYFISLQTTENAEQVKLWQIAFKHWPALKEYEALSHFDFEGLDGLRVVELLMVGIRQCRKDEYELLKKLLTKVIQSDSKLELKEWCFYFLLTSQLDAHFFLAKPKQAQYQKSKPLEAEFLTVLIMLIQQSSTDDEQRPKAYAKACDAMGLYHLSSQAPNFDQVIKFEDFSQSVKKLDLAFSLLKGRMLKALKLAALSDDQLEDDEQWFILSLAAIWGVAMPESFFNDAVDGLSFS